MPRRFVPSRLYGVEDVEDYQLGGLHPISIGDCFSEGRYRIVHKLGYGGSSTVWLARDEHRADQLVALKAMRADMSSERTSDMPELAIPEMLRLDLPPSVGIQTIHDHFHVQGPNGIHVLLVSPFAGPNIIAMLDCPGRAVGSRKLRADLACKVAKQIATALHFLHGAGVVHGDLTTSNILFTLSPHVPRWSDAELYANLGEPKTEEVRTWDGGPLPSCAPVRIVEPIGNRLMDASYLQENVILGDFGQSYAFASPPQDYQPGTAYNYTSPELRFEKRVGLEADMWALGCAIFEIRAGCALFESFFQSDLEIVVQTVALLGRLPDPWWSAFDKRSMWFEEDGEPKCKEDQELAGFAVTASKSSIREQLRLIGVGDELSVADGPMIERAGDSLPEEEVALLGDLLEKLLKYRPEERIKTEEVIEHPWFIVCSG